MNLKKSSLAAVVVTLAVAGPAAAVREPVTEGSPKSARQPALVAKKAHAKDARPAAVRYLGRH